MWLGSKWANNCTAKDKQAWHILFIEPPDIICGHFYFGLIDNVEENPCSLGHCLNKIIQLCPWKLRVGLYFIIYFISIVTSCLSSDNIAQYVVFYICFYYRGYKICFCIRNLSYHVVEMERIRHYKWQIMCETVNYFDEHYSAMCRLCPFNVHLSSGVNL